MTKISCVISSFDGERKITMGITHSNLSKIMESLSEIAGDSWEIVSITIDRTS